MLQNIAILMVIIVIIRQNIFLVKSSKIFGSKKWFYLNKHMGYR